MEICDYRPAILAVLQRYAVAGYELDRAVLEGSPEIIDRATAIDIADWLDDDCDWDDDFARCYGFESSDEMCARLAADIRGVLAGSINGR